MIIRFRKYWRRFGMSLQESMTYRAESLLWVIIDVIPLVAMVLLWLGVYRYGGVLLDYSLSGLITYYLSGFFLSRLTDTHFEEGAVEQVIDGSIARFFVKPINLFLYYVSGEFAWKLMGIFLSMGPIVLLINAFFHRWLVPVSFSQLGLLLCFAILGFCLESLFSFMIIAVSFFTDQGRAFNHFKWMLFSIFNGSLLPIEAYPAWLKSIAQFLPFKYLFAIPTSVYLGKISINDGLMQLVYGLVWIAVITGITAAFWRLAKTKFSAVGG